MSGLIGVVCGCALWIKKRIKAIGEKEMIGLFALSICAFWCAFLRGFHRQGFDFKRIITKSDQAKIKII